MTPSRPPSPSRTLSQRAAVVGLVGLLLVWLGAVTWKAVPSLLTVFGGVLIALLLSGLARWMSAKTSMSYRASLTVGGGSILVIGAGVGWFVGGGLIAQLSGLVQALPEVIGRAGEILESWGLVAETERAPDLTSLREPIRRVVSGAFGMVNTVVGSVSSFAFAALIGVYLAARPETYRSGLLRLVPLHRRERADEVVGAVVHAVRGWLVARVAIMAITLVTSYVGLVLIGVPFAGGLAVISAVAVFVPYVGAWISGTVAVLVALLVSVNTALYTALFYFGVQTLQGWTVEPLIEARYTSAPPALLLMGQVVSGLLFGVVGVLLASPLVIVVVVLVQTLYVQDALGDRSLEVLGTDEGGDPDRSPESTEGAEPPEATRSVPDAVGPTPASDPAPSRPPPRAGGSRRAESAR